MAKRSLSRLLFSLLLPAAAAAMLAAPAQAAPDVERGRYLADIMDCGGCHTRGVLMGKPDMALFLAGSEVGFQIPGLGIFYPPNLTADPETGIGAWSMDDIVRAVRTGERPDGRILAPIMPWRAYSRLTDDDAYSLAAFLKTLPPVVWQEEPQMIGEGQRPLAPYLTVAMPE